MSVILFLWLSRINDYQFKVFQYYFSTCFYWLKMHFLDHVLECPIWQPLKTVQLRQLFAILKMAAELRNFYSAARHPCVEVSDLYTLERKRMLWSGSQIESNGSYSAHFRTLKTFCLATISYVVSRAFLIFIMQ